MRGKHPVTIDGEIHDFNEAVLAKLFGDLHSFRNVRTLIMVVSGYLELFTNAIIKANCKNQKRILNDALTYPWSARTVLLNEMGLITDDQLKMIDWLRKIRNEAAHEVFFELTPKLLQKYPQKSPATEEGFRDICTQFLYDWVTSNSDLQIFLLSTIQEIKEEKPEEQGKK